MGADAAWVDRAECRGMDLDKFFPSWGDSAQEALDACARCPVRAECLEFALRAESSGPRTSVPAGIYGGVLAVERKAIQRKIRKRRAR